LNFFKDGFLVLDVDTSFLMKLPLSISFGKESGLYGSDATQTFKLDSECQPLTSFVDDVFARQFFLKLVKPFGFFSTANIIIHKYVKSNAMNWHHDVFDRSVLLVLAYISEDLFTEEDGGLLEIGRCEVDSKGFPIAEPKTVKTVLPNLGTVVLLNNTDPTLFHRVTPVQSEKTRLVVSCQLGFSDMVMINK
jgi:Rps23 Pro-64 3,4-dihydroxylase Tpa1-like proline 4-hydroxylase